MAGSAGVFFHGGEALNSVMLGGSMTERTEPRLPKWPFFLVDLLLIGVAAWIVSQAAKPLSTWPLISVVVCTGIGAWVCVTPFLKQHEADLKFAEADKLATTVEQINNLRSFTNQISFATAQWQVIQENSAKTVNAAKEIADRIAADARAFSEFMLKANDAEKAHLRFEIEKLRREEGNWVQLVVHLMDHVYALQQAAARSGQPAVANQLTQFQNACRELIRRVGLAPVDTKVGDPFDAKAHTLPDGHPPPPPGAKVTQVIATGYTFQGEPVRNALVVAKPAEIPPGTPAEPTEPEPQLGFEDKLADS
jgi:molecular chaperone GrpE (heat shock protein)